MKKWAAAMTMLLGLAIYFVFFKPMDVVPVYQYNPIAKFEHDKDFFTQGFEYQNGVFYEGSGLRGESELRITEINTGAVLQKRSLDDLYFGEGITILADQIYQLTWQSGKGFIYDLKTLKIIGEFPINGEGWGLTNDGSKLIMSNGSDRLMFFEPKTLRQTGEVSVKLGGKPLLLLNELEFINGDVWANIWKDDQIVIIDPSTGNVKSIIDLSNFSERRDRHDVSNGIAFDRSQNIVYVTGKNWSHVYALELDMRKVYVRSYFSRAMTRFGFLFR